MKFIMELIAYVTTHGPTIVILVLTVLAAAEAAVRLTPTEKDDGAVERIGKKIRGFFDLLEKVFPNLKKGGGVHPPLAQKEAEKPKDQKQ